MRLACYTAILTAVLLAGVLPRWAAAGEAVEVEVAKSISDPGLELLAAGAVVLPLFENGGAGRNETLRTADIVAPGDIAAHLVRDHFAILKVGPALTFAFRQAAFSLARMETELVPEEKRSRLIERLDAAMLRDPAHWKNHYHGTPQEIALARMYSLSDRVRYYWAQPDVQAALSLLLKNLESRTLPPALLNQHFPHLITPIREGRLENSPRAILLESINQVLKGYDQACRG